MKRPCSIIPLQALGDPGIELARVAEPQPSPPSPVNAELFARIAEAARGA